MGGLIVMDKWPCTFAGFVGKLNCAACLMNSELSDALEIYNTTSRRVVNMHSLLRAGNAGKVSVLLPSQPVF